MPLYYYQCEICKTETRRICTPDESVSAPMCCERHMKRTPRPATTRCVECLDNHVMTRKLERLVDAERLFHERAEATKKSQNGD